MGSNVLCAGQIDLPNGLRIWIPPPPHKPYWVNKRPSRAGPDLTDREVRQYLTRKDKGNDKQGMDQST